MLQVPGASLYYEVRGAGSILLMIAAGAGDADSYRSLADALADHYTVVTYDRRGFARSPLDDSDQPIEIGTHSNDAHHLLAALTSETAYVLGSSIGAIIGLDLAIHHAEQIRTLVAHEPQINALLSETEQAEFRQAMMSVFQMFQQNGSAAAIQQFAANVGVSRSIQGRNVGQPQVNADYAEINRQSFFRYDTMAVSRYRLDVAGLKEAPTRIVIGGGANKTSLPYRSALALANQLGTALVEFPGNHAGFVEYPQEFAEALRKVYGV